MYKFLSYTLLFLTALVLNATWEFLHAPLYTCCASSYLELWLSLYNFNPETAVLYRSILGDGLFVLLLTALTGFIARDYFWFLRAGRRELIWFSFFSLILALSIEWRAMLTSRWFYTEAMPVVPFLGVGLSPFLELAVTGLVSIFITAYVFKRSRV